MTEYPLFGIAASLRHSLCFFFEFVLHRPGTRPRRNIQGFSHLPSSARGGHAVSVVCYTQVHSNSYAIHKVNALFHRMHICPRKPRYFSRILDRHSGSFCHVAIFCTKHGADVLLAPRHRPISLPPERQQIMDSMIVFVNRAPPAHIPRFATRLRTRFGASSAPFLCVAQVPPLPWVKYLKSSKK